MSDQTVHRVDATRQPANPDWFEGRVEMEAIHPGTDTGVRQGRVHFHAGAHTRWHLHVGDQVLYFVAGKGIAQALGEDVIECEPGDVVQVHAGTRHIHGAAPGHDATHIAITTGETIWDIDPRYPE